MTCMAFRILFQANSDPINRPAAIPRAAVTAARIRQECLFVIDGYFFAGFDVPQREEKHVTVKGPHVSIGVAGMIDVVSAVPAAGAIEAPLAVDIADAQVPASTRSFHCFPV